jgi:hypothetical protein
LNKAGWLQIQLGSQPVCFSKARVKQVDKVFLAAENTETFEKKTKSLWLSIH